MKRKYLWLLAVLLVCALGWYLASRTGRRSEGLRLYGNVDIRQVELSFRVPGKIAQVRVDEGDRVTAGEPLAQLDAKPYEDALAKARAERDVALAGLNKYHAGFRSEDIAQAKAEVAQLAAQVENADRLARRRKTRRPLPARFSRSAHTAPGNTSTEPTTAVPPASQRLLNHACQPSPPTLSKS